MLAEKLQVPLDELQDDSGYNEAEVPPGCFLDKASNTIKFSEYPPNDNNSPCTEDKQCICWHEGCKRLRFPCEDDPDTICRRVVDCMIK